MNAEIFHLFHSGTAVRFQNKLFIFDYYNDNPRENGEAELSSLEKGVIRADSFAGIDKAYVFVSHSHHDHYNKVIFDWEKYSVDLNYILAEEVSLSDELKDKSNLYQLAPDEELQLNQLKIKTLGSTDAGVSFLLKMDQLNIFHSGDLNWWNWKKFSPRVQKREEREFKREVDKLRGEKLDIAFVPVDPRLEEYYYLAGEYFIEEIKPKLFIPLHFSDNFEVTKKFKDNYSSPQTEIAEISKRGEKIDCCF